MQGNSFFGFSGGGGGTPPPTTDSWLLDGNTNGAEKYFGTNDNYSIPIYTNGAAIGIFLNTGDFGFGTVLPTSRVHIKGVDSTSSNYALKADNSATSPLFSVRNDGISIFGNVVTVDGKDVTNYPISIRSSRIDLTRIQNLNSGNIQTDIQIGNNNGANSIYYGVNTAGNSFIDNRTGNLLFQNTGVTQMTFDNTGKFGIGVNPLAQLHAKGIDATTKVNLRLEPITDVTEDTTGDKVVTTDATANVTAQTIAVPTDKVISIESTIVYRKTAGAGVGTVGDGTTIKLNSSVKNVSGTLTLDTVQNTYTGTTNAIVGVSATYTISGTNVLVSVTGVVDDNITWNVITKVNTVG